MFVPAGPEVPMLIPTLPVTPRVAVGGVRPTLLVPDRVVVYLLGLAHRLVERQYSRPRYPEDYLDALILHHPYDRVHHVHSGHACFSFPKETNAYERRFLLDWLFRFFLREVFDDSE